VLDRRYVKAALKRYNQR